MSLKLLDYGAPKPFWEIVGKPRNLAWPVNAYRVTLPKVSEDGDGLNSFERVILKMIDAGGARGPEALATETCIPIDLVQCVLLRLHDKAFIDEHNEIIKPTRDNWENEEGNEPDFVTALFFRELATGKILPFHHRLDDNNPLRKKETTRFFKIRDDVRNGNSPPTPRDVISALRAIKKRSMAFDSEVRLPVAQQITIIQEPELYYLDCPIVIQKGDGEFRIADPFGNGFSLVLENAFSHLIEQDSRLSEWLMNWKQSLSNPRQDQQDATYKEPYDNDANQGRYPNLVSNLRLKRNTQYRSIEQIHAALEWALFYACTQRSYDAAVKQLRFTNQSEHPNLLKGAAQKAGLNPPQSGFRAVWGGKLDDFLSGKADMGTLLSIVLLMAESDASHPLHRIAAQHQDFIIQVFDIKNIRDEKGHGKGKGQESGYELPEEAFMREIVTVLLPAIRFSDTLVEQVDSNVVTDLLLDARTSIQAEFGFKLFNRLGTELQERLIHTERFWLSCKDGDNAQPFAFDLCAALQKEFRQKLTGVLPPDIKDSDFFATAQKNASLSKLGQLPKSLRTVNPLRIRETLQGDDKSLGACVIVFLLVSNLDTLCSVAATQPTFISDIASVLNLREHGNTPLPLPKDDICKLRKSTYLTIKTLLET
jgi:hypothetical protein